MNTFWVFAFIVVSDYAAGYVFGHYLAPFILGQ